MTYIAHLDPDVQAALEAADETAPVMPADVADPERFVPEAVFNGETAQDRADLDLILAWEAFEGFGN